MAIDSSRVLNVTLPKVQSSIQDIPFNPTFVSPMFEPRTVGKDTYFGSVINASSGRPE